MLTDYLHDHHHHHHHQGLLFAASGDNTLTTYDLKGRKFLGRSMDQEDELLSLCVVKHGRKLVAGTQSGVLLVYSWGQWANCSDRFVGHPETVEALVKVDEVSSHVVWVVCRWMHALDRSINV